MNQDLKTERRDQQPSATPDSQVVKRIPLFTDEPQTLAELFLRAKEKHNRPDVLNCKRGGEWRKISSEEMISRAENIALGLFALGLRKDDKAAILAANSPEWTLADAGCQFAGIVDVPIYTTLAPDSIRYILNDSEAENIFHRKCGNFLPHRGNHSRLQKSRKARFFRCRRRKIGKFAVARRIGKTRRGFQNRKTRID